MARNYSKLIGRIIEMYGTRREFAKQIGLSFRSLSAKLNNRTDFSQSEIQACLEALDIRHEDIEEYFFTPLVQKY